MKNRRIRLLLLGLAVLVGGLFGGGILVRRPAAEFTPTLSSALSQERGVSGVVHLSVYGSSSRADVPLRHITEYVNSRQYRGQYNNDLRGFLDGTFKYGWNQPGQTHVRVGRRDRAPRYGELELFRVVLRWDSLSLPPGARVLGASLRLGIEAGPSRPVSVFLYRIRRGWNPGNGGVLENNVSPPKQGEVWWNDAGFAQQSWGLPGVGFASSDSTIADTDPMPLNAAVYSPNTSVVEFSSRELAALVTERINQGAPLLLLVKLSDVDEDIPGSVLTVYSGTEGDDGAVSRRPRLALEWESPREAGAASHEVALEYGRSLVLPRLVAKGTWHAVTFLPDPGSPSPLLELRGGRDGVVSDWQPAGFPLEHQWDWVEARISAVAEPVVLGQPFTAAFSNTWVRTAAPERQKVPWVFIAPSGRRHEVEAAYQGNYRWAVTLVPDELGRWTYSWQHSFDEQGPHPSVPGRFDVVIGDRANALRQLAAFVKQLQRDSLAQDPARLDRRMTQFMRLERAAMQLETPETFRSPSANELRGMLRAARALLGSQPVPDSIPLVPDEPLPWQSASRRR